MFDEDGRTGSPDTITSTGGTNLSLHGVLPISIYATLGTNIILGDNGDVIVGGDIVTTEPAIGGADTIVGGTAASVGNTILGGAASDTIIVGGGTNTVLGDNGAVRRTNGVITKVETFDEDGLTGGPDTITSNGGTNIIVGGIGGDTNRARRGTSIILGDR